MIICSISGSIDIIKQKGHRCIYHFYRWHIREITTAQYYQAYLFGWIKTYYGTITIYASIMPYNLSSKISSPISHDDPIYS